MGAFLLSLAMGGLNILKLLGRGLGRFFRSLNGQGWVGLILSLTLGVLLVIQKGDTCHWKKQAGQYEQLYGNEKLQHQQTVLNYRKAAEDARDADKANVARVKAEQGQINQEREDALETRLTAARALAERLRGVRAGTADTGSRGGASMSGVPAPAGGTNQAAGEDRLSDPDALTATEQAIQLDELIKWVKRQAGIDVNRPPAPVTH